MFLAGFKLNIMLKLIAANGDTSIYFYIILRFSAVLVGMLRI